MVGHGMAKMAAVHLALCLAVCPAARAADDTETAKPSQADPDDRSYLPPWMQNQNAATVAASPAATAVTPPAKSAEAGDQDALKKPKNSSPAQKIHWNGFFDNPLTRGVAGVFGR